jgi:dTDP-4-amino-4,6-dideoxygalactose transaminase
VLARFAAGLSRSVSVKTVTRSDSPARQDIPFLDMRPMHVPIRDAVLAEVAAVIDSNAYVNGPQVREFEASFAAYCGVSECVGVASGLDALRLAFLAADLEPGAEVIVPANTFVATLEAVSQAGLRPVPVDVLDTDYGLDVTAAEAAVTDRTCAIAPVSLYGQMPDMQAIGSLARRRGLIVVEDAAQAHGAERDGLRSGAASLAAAFSFYPAKNLGAMGDAGALVTDDEAIAERVRALREHGQRQKYVHEWEGYTARLDTVQAAVLNLKLPLLDGWNASRAAAATWYGDSLSGIGDLVLPAVAPHSSPVWHLYVVRTADPDGLAECLRARGIGTGRHYPVPAHLAPAYAGLGFREGAFPVAESLSRACLSLPMFPGIEQSQVAAVADAIAQYFGNG